MASVNSGFTPVSSSFPLSAISLMVSSSPFYDDAVNSMIVSINMVYREFLRSDEGQGFRGEVSTNTSAFGLNCHFVKSRVPVVSLKTSRGYYKLHSLLFLSFLTGPENLTRALTNVFLTNQ